jgi:excisionase family DNA binding protein
LEPEPQGSFGGAAPTPERPSLHSIATTAKRLDVSEKSVRRYVDSGRLPAYKIGGQIRILEEDFRSFLASCRMNSGNTNKH